MTTYNQKMNDNITLDSTIAGLVNYHSQQTTREEGRICSLISKFCKVPSKDYSYTVWDQ